MVESFMEFRILGPVEIGPDRQNGLGTPKQRALLSVLLLNANRVVSVDRLLGALWDGPPPSSATANVYSYVAGVRQLLDAAGESSAERLVTRMPGYLFSVRAGELDLSVFDQLAQQGRAALRCGDYELAADCLTRASAVWRGRPLENIRVTSGLGALVAAIEERRVNVFNDLIHARLRLGQHTELVGELREMIGLSPFSELTWSQFMFALYRSGRKADALAAFLEARQMMVSQMGVEPSAYLRRMHQAILVGAPSVDLLENCWHR